MAFTLIEVLIALVVLMVGIYAMLRIFPRGFQAIEVSQDRTTASQLAEAELARWKLRPEALPDAIVATDYEGHLIPATLTNNERTLRSLLVYGELAARLPGSAAFSSVLLDRQDLAFLDQLARPLIYNPLDTTSSQFDVALGYQGVGTVTVHPNWQPNSLYLPRTILGERIDVRRLSRTRLGVPFYLLSHAPLDILRLGSDPNAPPSERRRVYVDVYDAQVWSLVPWPTGAGGAPALDPPLLKARQFSLGPNSSSGQLELHFGPNDGPPNQPRLFKVDYTDPFTLQRVIGMSVVVPPGSSVGTTTLDPATSVDTVQVNERLQPTDDRSLLLIADDTARRNIYYVDPETTISGRLEFPLVLQIDPRETDIALVKVDYRVYDWAILQFDVEVPADGRVRLVLDHIKGPGFTNPPRQDRSQEVARGIKPYYDWSGNDLNKPFTDMETWAYVVAVDRQSGEILVDHEGIVWPANPYERRERFLVDYRNGVLDFNYDQWDVPETWNPAVDAPDRSGRTYRVFCRAEDDWAVQLMVAARRYGRSSTGLPGGDPVAPEGGMTGNLLTYAWLPGRDRRQIYLPLSELGHTVAVDYYYRSRDTGKLTYIEGEIHQVEGPNVVDLGEWVCRLAEPLEREPHMWGPLRVRGVSVRARAMWTGPGSSATLQDLAYALGQQPRIRARSSLSEVWRQSIVTTYLTQAPI
jgi:type II secretory pathway pseudopilin PulG